MGKRIYTSRPIRRINVKTKIMYGYAYTYSVKPVSGALLMGTGIGFMIIGSTFKVG